MTQRSISILGVTGSIGQSTADIVLSAPERFSVQVVSASTNADKLATMAIELRARVAVIADESCLDALETALEGSGVEARGGRAALIEASSEPVDITMAAIVGIAGLEPLMAAIEHSRAVAIANKEPLVAAGPLVMAAAAKHDCKILPVDSEHNAIFQVFENDNRASIERIILTASGGPFLKSSIEDMAGATPAQAVAHPNWSMGAKISVDSASMMNKALEVIEAHYLFDMPAEQIDVLIHPQSVVHSMVEYADGSVLSQMGASDMRTPIAYALAWPERMPTTGDRLKLDQMSALEFSVPDHVQFPALSKAYECLRKGLRYCIALNAANEVAVEAFLAEKIGFLEIIEVIDCVIESVQSSDPSSLEDVIKQDESCRAAAWHYIDKQGRTQKVS